MKPQQSRASGVFTRGRVEEREVLEVGDLSPLPALGHVGGFEKLPRRGQGDAPGENMETAKSEGRCQLWTFSSYIILNQRALTLCEA